MVFAARARHAKALDTPTTVTRTDPGSLAFFFRICSVDPDNLAFTVSQLVTNDSEFQSSL